VFAFLGAGDLELTGGFRGTVLVPSGRLTLGMDGSRGTYEGTFYGKHVLIGPKVSVRKLPIPLFGADLEGCAARVPVRIDLPPEERDVAYQADIASSCSMPGISSCRAYLIGRTNVDYTAAAARMITGNFSPAEYLAVVRDRTRKLRATEDNTVLAMLLCTAPDADGDGVSDADDVCPGTDLPDGILQLKVNRFAANTVGVFVGAKGTPSGYTIADTGGCSATQIISAAGLGNAHARFGVTRSALDTWVASLA